jgi:hypothetical protein
MNRMQKMAWYKIIVIVATGIVTTCTVATLNYTCSASQARAGLGCLGLLGFLGLADRIFRKSTDKIDFDERDLLIQRKATVVAYSVFWVFWIASSMAIWAIKKPGGSITVEVLPLMVLAGGVVVTLMHSVAILVQYGWKEKSNE